MTHAFPDSPELSDILSQRSFSLPQQNYLLTQFLLKQCHDEAQRWLEGEYPPEELTDRTSLVTLECLDLYRDQLGYDEILEDAIEAKKHLIEWGFEQLQKGEHTFEVMEILARKTLIAKRPRLTEDFVELCMGMQPEAPQHATREQDEGGE